MLVDLLISRSLLFFFFLCQTVTQQDENSYDLFRIVSHAPHLSIWIEVV